MIDLSKMDKKSLARVFDYSILPKETQEAAIRKGCALTRQYQFAAFYSSSPFWAPVIKEELADYPDIEIGTGIAFAWGSQTPSVKAFETEEAVRLGCTAVDICMNVGALKDRRYDVVSEELRLFVQAAGSAVTKCIIEACFLTDEEIAAACKLIQEAGVQYAKTSSGQFEGPTLEQFMVMRWRAAGSS
jgi:deoxyribose-phosphate aldolase